MEKSFDEELRDNEELGTRMRNRSLIRGRMLEELGIRNRVGLGK